MIYRVAQRVGQRVFNRFDKTAVQSRLLPCEFNADRFRADFGEIAHHARKALEQLRQGQHSRLHHSLPQFLGQTVQTFRSLRRSDIVSPLVEDLVPGQDQFAHQMYHPVEDLNIDPDGRLGVAASFHLGPRSGQRKGRASLTNWHRITHAG
jgi:hypothetical protein